MKITIFGNPGTGTSTVGKLLAEKLGYEFKSSGNMFRDMAKGLNISIYELDTAAQTDSQYDIKLDEMVAEYGKTHSDFIFESRLAWHFIPDSIKISLVLSADEAARRVAKRDGISVEEAKKNNNLRIETYQNRFPKYYPELTYPPTDDIFDLVVDVESVAPEDIVQKITRFLNGRTS